MGLGGDATEMLSESVKRHSEETHCNLLRLAFFRNTKTDTLDLQRSRPRILTTSQSVEADGFKKN